MSAENKQETPNVAAMNIYQRLLAATAKIGFVAKNLTVDTGNNKSYKAVAETDVLIAVKAIEAEYRIYSYPFSRKIIKDEVYVQTKTYNGNTTEKNTYFMRIETVYRFVNIDKPDEYIDIVTYGDGVDAQDKAPGKAMTYADKYALLKCYKIPTGDDPDAEGSGDMRNPKKQGNKEPAPEPPPPDKPTPERLEQAQKLGIKLENVAAYFKCAVEDITDADLAEAIRRKEANIKKKAAAAQENKTEGDAQ